MLPGAARAIARLTSTGHRVAVVTNQSAVARGLVTWPVLNAIHACIAHQVERVGGAIEGFFVCPHHPAAGCDCRKPKPGLLARASRELALDLDGSFLVGDQVTDIEAAHAAGCLGLLVASSVQGPPVVTTPEGCVGVFRNLPDAVDYILCHE
jgi:D-glycero-D-manno-heptose 1,7-bisphosphate phosphatase